MKIYEFILFPDHISRVNKNGSGREQGERGDERESFAIKVMRNEWQKEIKREVVHIAFRRTNERMNEVYQHCSYYFGPFTIDNFVYCKFKRQLLHYRSWRTRARENKLWRSSVRLSHGKFIRYICFAKLLKTFLINYSGRLKNDDGGGGGNGVCLPFWRKAEIGCFYSVVLVVCSFLFSSFFLTLFVLPLHLLLNCYHIPRRFLALCVCHCLSRIRIFFSF